MTKNREVLFAIVTVLWIVAPAGAQDREGNARISINPSQEYHQSQPGISTNPGVRRKLHRPLFPERSKGNVQYAD
jgi:hypothetical protein